MEPNKTAFTVTKSEEDKKRIILTNVLTMLSNRIYIDKNGDKQPLLDKKAPDADKIDTAISPTIDLDKYEKRITDAGDNTFTIKVNNGEHYAIKIVFQRISATGKTSAISDFFREFAQFRKIIIAREFNNKISDYVTKNQTQIFIESALLHDIIRHRDQPRFELMSPKEMEQFKQEYNVTDYTINKMLRKDPITKYFGLKKGDVIRVIRPSPTAGEAIAYRIVS